MQNKKKKGIFVLVILFIAAVAAMFLTDLFLAQVELTLNIEGEGELSPGPGVHSFDPGELVELEAEALPGWKFIGWEGDLTEDAAKLELTIEEDMELTAVFEMEEYALDLDFDEERGRIVIDPEKDVYEYGDEVEFTAEPEEGYRFESWTGDLEGEDPTVTVEIAEGMEIGAEFAREEYTLSLNVEGDGEISWQIVELPEEDMDMEESGVIDDAEEIILPHGTSVELEAEALPGWEFLGWEGDITAEEAVIELNIEEDMNITALFEMEEYVLDLDYDEERGRIAIEPERENYLYGETVEIRAEAEEHFVFSRWLGDLESDEPEKEFVVEGSMEIIAEFDWREYQLSVEFPEEQGSVEIDPDKERYHHGESVVLRAESAEGWVFDRWSGDIDSADKEVEIEIEADTYISPEFSREEHVIFLEYDEDRGSVQISPDSEYYYAGEEVYLVAEAEEGYEFERWSGDIESEETELNITVEDDLELRAEFSPVRYTIYLEIFGAGEVEILPEKDYYYHGEEITLIAHPEISWEFLRWSGDIDSENEEVNIIIEDNKDIEVRFRFEK